MSYYIVKLIITTLLIVLISEISKRSSFIGAILASAPLVSVLAMMWLYIDTRDVSKISALSSSIFWLVLASLPLFIALPLLLKAGVNFYLSMGISIGVMVLLLANGDLAGSLWSQIVSYRITMRLSGPGPMGGFFCRFRKRAAFTSAEGKSQKNK